MGKSEYINHIAPVILPSDHQTKDGNNQGNRVPVNPVNPAHPNFSPLVKSEGKDKPQKVFTVSLV